MCKERKKLGSASKQGVDRVRPCARAPSSPERTPDEELQAGPAQEQYGALRNATNSLRWVSSATGVGVLVDGGRSVSLRTGAEALYYLGVLGNIMQQHMLWGKALLDWRQVAANLHLAGVLRFYCSRHPVSRVQGRAGEVLHQLQALLDGPVAFPRAASRAVRVVGDVMVRSPLLVWLSLRRV